MSDKHEYHLVMDEEQYEILHNELHVSYVRSSDPVQYKKLGNILAQLEDWHKREVLHVS